MNAATTNVAWPPRRILLWGVLWALFLSAAEFLVIAPLHAQPLLAFLLWWLVAWLLPMWCAIGCLLLLVARRCEPLDDWFGLVVGCVLVALGGAALQAVLLTWLQPAAEDPSSLGRLMARVSSMAAFPPRSPLLILAYDLWVGLFYGGLLAAAYVLMVRNERMRSLLRDAAIARSRTEALLDEARLQALQAQVDPQLLLSALDEVRALYHREPERADALLDRLVEFLRTALPGLKQRRSTLQAELQLAQAHAELQALLPCGTRWRVDLPQPLPQLRFPSLLLLPILSLPTRHDAPRLVVRIVDDKARLKVQGLGRELPPRIAQHTLACLHELLGPSPRLRANESPQTQLTIELDLPATTKEQDDAHRSSR